MEAISSFVIIFFVFCKNKSKAIRTKDAFHRRLTDLQLYKIKLDSLCFPRKDKWVHSKHIPLQIKDRKLLDDKGKVIVTLNELERQLSPDEDHIFLLENTYANTPYGILKIKVVEYEHNQDNRTINISIDVKKFIKAILKDALNGDIELI